MSEEDERQLGELESVLQRRLSAWRWRIRAEVMDELVQHLNGTVNDIRAKQARIDELGREYQRLEGAAETRVALADWAANLAMESAGKAEKAERTADSAARGLT